MSNILALGADNKTAFSAYTGSDMYLSEPVDDLAFLENYIKYSESIRKYEQENGFRPDVIVCDRHPEYHSLNLAGEIMRKDRGIRIFKVQHHFAHIVSCMYDNNLDEEVIGVCFDGTGYGDDGNSWGGEFFLCSRSSYRRMSHFEYIRVPGGDAAAREGWRMAVSFLIHAYGSDFIDIELPLFNMVGAEKIMSIQKMIEQDVNSPLSSSAGRIFDAVAALTGICEVSRYEAEAAIALEQSAARNVETVYEYEISGENIRIHKIIKGIVEDIINDISLNYISAKFHNTIGDIIFDVCGILAERTGINKVLISGGCFQNKYITEYLKKKFDKKGLMLYKHNKYPTTDLGLSVGQAVIANELTADGKCSSK